MILQNEKKLVSSGIALNQLYCFPVAPIEQILNSFLEDLARLARLAV